MISFPPAGKLSLHELLDTQYVLLRPIKRSTHQQMRVSLNRFQQFLRRPPTVSDLERLTVARWVQWLGQSGVSANTVRSKRRDLMSLASFAHEEELLDEELKKVPLPKVPRRVPEAWTPEQMLALLAAARLHRRGAVMEATMRVCWDSCCRISAVHTASFARYNALRGIGWLHESKTGVERPYQFTPATRTALSRLPAGRTLLCGDVCRRSLQRWLAEIVVTAGFIASRRRQFHCIRRSKVTQMVIFRGPQAAADHAGHANTSMLKFYDDTSLHPTEGFVDELGLPELPQPKPPAAEGDAADKTG